MTGIPDAYNAWDEYDAAHPLPPLSDEFARGFMAGFAAAEGPWREHLATELEAVAEGIETNDLQYESGQRWAFWEAARIVRGTNDA